MTVIPLPFLSFFSSDITLLKTNAAPRVDEEKAAALMPVQIMGGHSYFIQFPKNFLAISTDSFASFA